MSAATSQLRRVRVGGLATVLAFGIAPAIAVADADFDRVGSDGGSRYETSAEIASLFGASQNAILASGETGHYADAVSANYLAGQLEAPILLTRIGTTPDVILDQLEENGVENIAIVGGPEAVSREQQQELEDAGYHVTRMWGDNRFETTEDVIAEVGDAPSDTALIATGFGFADALAGGPLAYAQGMPVALSGTNTIRTQTLAVLEDAGVTQALILGGPVAVSNAVRTQLEAAGIDVIERLAGETRSGTSVAIANYAVENDLLGIDGVNLASGDEAGGGADALSGGPLSGKQNRPLLITDNATTLSYETNETTIPEFLTESAVTLTDGLIFGGPEAVSPEVEEAVEEAVQTGAPEPSEPPVPPMPPVPPNMPPTIEDVFIDETGGSSANVTDASDVIQMTFSETMDEGAVGQWAFTAEDVDGDLYEISCEGDGVACGLTDTGDGTNDVLTIVITNPANGITEPDGETGEVSPDLPLEVVQASDNVEGVDGAALDVAGSADTVIDSEDGRTLAIAGPPTFKVASADNIAITFRASEPLDPTTVDLDAMGGFADFDITGTDATISSVSLNDEGTVIIVEMSEVLASGEMIALKAGSVTDLADGSEGPADPALWAASAELAIDFSDDDYTFGDQSPAGQNGWYGWGAFYDWALVDAADDFPYSGISKPALRFSNAIDDTRQYGNIRQLSSPVIQAAGEESTGAMYDTFEASFTVASATGGLQSGLLTEVDIDGRVGTTSGGSRAGGVIGLRHLEGSEESEGGLQIFARWPTPGSEADFDDWRNASVVVRADKPHEITVRAHFVEDGDDILEVFVDGDLEIVGSTLEGYHDAVAAFESQDPAATDKQTVNSLLFRTSTTGPTENGEGWSSVTPDPDEYDGKGFLYSDIFYRVFNTIR